MCLNKNLQAFLSKSWQIDYSRGIFYAESIFAFCQAVKSKMTASIIRQNEQISQHWL